MTRIDDLNGTCNQKMTAYKNKTNWMIGEIDWSNCKDYPYHLIFSIK